jgi:uncharacterized lipoprotein YajG
MAVALKVANIRSSSTSKTATVVLAISYFRGDQLLGQHTYRGSSTGVNWFASEDEINDAFSETFSQILKAMSKDVDIYCTAL